MDAVELIEYIESGQEIDIERLDIPFEDLCGKLSRRHWIVLLNRPKSHQISQLQKSMQDIKKLLLDSLTLETTFSDQEIREFIEAQISGKFSDTGPRYLLKKTPAIVEETQPREISKDTSAKKEISQAPQQISQLQQNSPASEETPPSAKIESQELPDSGIPQPQDSAKSDTVVYPDRLGGILCQRGIIDEQQLEKALQYQQQNYIKLGEAVIELGFASPLQIASALAELFQLLYIDHINVDNSVIENLPLEICQQTCVIPAYYEDDTLVIAAADPTNLIDKVFFLGAKVKWAITAPHIILSALQDYERSIQPAKPLVGPRRRLGQILIALKEIDEKQLQEALEHQQQHGIKLGEALIKLEYVTQLTITQALARQFSLPFVDVSRGEISSDVIECIPRQIVEERQVLPVKKTDRSLIIAMTDPLDLVTLEDLRFLLGCEVEAALTTPQAMEEAIKRYYGIALDELQDMYTELTQADLDDEDFMDEEDYREEIIEKVIVPIEERDLRRDRLREEPEEAEIVETEEAEEVILEKPEIARGQIAPEEPKDYKQEQRIRRIETDDDAPVIRLISLILGESLQRKADEIKIAPKGDRFEISYNVKGQWQEVDSPPKRLQNAILYRFQCMADVDASKDLLDVGKIAITIKNQKLNLQVYFMPGQHGNIIHIKFLSDEQQLQNNIQICQQHLGRKISTSEKMLSETAGEPGLFERLIAQSQIFMKSLQVTIGVNAVYVIHCFDTIAGAITGYLKTIHSAWKTWRTARKRVQRHIKNSLQQELLDDLQKAQKYLDRLFSLSLTQENDLPNETTFALKLVLETRGHLDEMKQDLNLLTSREIGRTAQKTVKDFVLSFIPNPVELYLYFKDLIILGFYLRYSRFQVENTSRDTLYYYQQMIDSLQTGSDETQKYLIEKTRKNLQRLLQILCKPSKIVDPCYWSRYDLLWEVKRWHNEHPMHNLELEKWLRNELEKILDQKASPSAEEKQLRAQEKQEFQLRYHWGQKLHQQFLL